MEGMDTEILQASIEHREARCRKLEADNRRLQSLLRRAYKLLVAVRPYTPEHDPVAWGKAFAEWIVDWRPNYMDP